MMLDHGQLEVCYVFKTKIILKSKFTGAAGLFLKNTLI
jgi:hypothetical protein